MKCALKVSMLDISYIFSNIADIKLITLPCQACKQVSGVAHLAVTFCLLMTWTRPGQSKPSHDQASKKGNTFNITKDAGWAWVIAVCCSLGVSMSMSLVNSMGILYTAMVDELPFEFMSLTIIGSAHTALSMAAAVFAIPVVERFGIRPVIITSGIVMSVGCLLSAFLTSYVLLLFCLGIIPGCAAAFAFVTFIIACDRYFEKRKAIAMTLVTSGGSASVVIFPQLLKMTCDIYGFKGSLIIMSSILLNICLCGALIFPLSDGGKSKGQTTSALQQQPLGFRFMKEPGYVIFLISNVLMMAGLFLPPVFLPETIQIKGLALNVVNYVFLISGLSQILGRLISGFCASRKPLYVTFICSMFMIFAGLSLLIVPLCTEMSHFLAFGLINGFFLGGGLVCINLAMRNLVEDKYFGRALSIVLLVEGLGGLCGNPLAAILQALGIYIPYYFGCVVFVVSGIILLPFSKAKIRTPLEVVLDVTVEEGGYKLYHKALETVGDQVILYERELGMYDLPFTS